MKNTAVPYNVIHKRNGKFRLRKPYMVLENNFPTVAAFEEAIRIMSKLNGKRVIGFKFSVCLVPEPRP